MARGLALFLLDYHHRARFASKIRPNNHESQN
jgi:hypothetical protein